MFFMRFEALFKAQVCAATGLSDGVEGMVSLQPGYLLTHLLLCSAPKQDTEIIFQASVPATQTS